MRNFGALSHNLKPLTSTLRMYVEVDTVGYIRQWLRKKTFFFQEDKTDIHELRKSMTTRIELAQF